MLNHASLCGLVVIRGDQKTAGRAELLGLFGHHDGMRRVVGARSGDDRDPARSLVDSVTDRLQMLVIFQCRSLSGRAAGPSLLRLAAVWLPLP